MSVTPFDIFLQPVSTYHVRVMSPVQVLDVLKPEELGFHRFY